MSDTLLSRLSSLPAGSQTPLQSQVDGLVGSFTEQATDWKSLAAMMAGGMTYRLGRVGVLSVSANSASLLRGLAKPGLAMAAGIGRMASLGIGLGVEVTAFEMTNRSLVSLTGDTRANSNLWRWDGQGGIRQGLLSSLVTFGTLKGAGRLAQGENVVVQHLLQDSAMVLGHQVSAAFGITPRPTGTLAEQFLHAEVINLQLGAGMALAHSFAPGVQGIERGLDLSLRAREAETFRPWPILGQASLVVAGGRGSFSPTRSSGPAKGPDMVFMVPGGNAKHPSDPSTLTSPGGSDETSTIREEEKTIPRVGREAETLAPSADSDSTTVREEERTTPDSASGSTTSPSSSSSSVPVRIAEKDRSPGSTAETILAPIAERPEIPPPAPGPADSTTPDPAGTLGEPPVPDVPFEPQGPERMELPQGQRGEAMTVALGPAARDRQEAKRAQGEDGAEPPLPDEPVAPAGSQDIPTREPRHTPSTMWLKDGSLLADRYKVIEPLGAGGFGIVYKVEDTLMGRIVVVKVPREEVDTDLYLPRFENEIKITYSLDPRRVVIVHDVIQLKEQRRILPVMEYVPGDDLSDILKDGKLSMEKRLNLFVKICEGVESAHRRWIVHRDLKPRNIRITHDGDVKIMDWGLGKYFGKRRRASDLAPIPDQGEEPPSIQNLRENLTAAGSAPGTPGYIAPEAWRDPNREDLRPMDVFALGVTLYEMVTGRHPFLDGSIKKSPHLYLSTHPDFIGTPPAFRDVLQGDLPKDVWKYVLKIEEICRRAMDPDPERRYGTARELREAVSMVYAQTAFDRVIQLGEEMQALETEMHAAWGEYRVDRQISPELEERMIDTLNALKRKRQQREQAAESLTLYLTRLTDTDPVPEARRMIAELSWMRLVEADDLMDESVRRDLEDRIREFDLPAPAAASSSISAENTLPMAPLMEALEGRISLAIRGADAVSGEGIEKIGVRAIPIEEYKPGYFREGDPFFSGDLQSFLRRSRLSVGYYVMEFDHPQYAFFRYPLRVDLSQVRRGIVDREPLRLNLGLLPKQLVPQGFVMVHGGEATVGHNIHRFDDPSFVISVPERRIRFNTFAATNPVTVSQYARFIEGQLAGINSRIEEGNIEAAVQHAERVRQWIPRNQPQVARRDLEDANRESLLASSFEGPQYHWRINAEGMDQELRFTLTDPTSHRSLRDDPITADQPIHSIPYEATEAYADWLYEGLRAQGYEGPRPRPPTVTELEILSRNSFPWTFPWGYHFRRTFVSSRLVHRDLSKDTYAHPVGDHPLGTDFYRDYSLYEGRDSQGRPLRLGHLVGGVREWTSSVTEQNAVHQYGGSPRTPAGSFFLPSARMYFPKDITDDLHGGFRLVIPFPALKPSPR